jgi:nucleotide-binding universal stress UspA family protein
MIRRTGQAIGAKATQRRGRGGKRPALSLRRILVPIDFSGKSRQALEFAVPLAASAGGGGGAASALTNTPFSSAERAGVGRVHWE